MPIFHYKAKNKNAETIVGKIEAIDQEEAIDKISRFDLTPVSVTMASDAGGENTNDTITTGRVRQKELYVFSRQFASLLKAGVPILKALNVLQHQTSNRFFQHVIASVHADVQGGSSFSDSIKKFPKVFPLIYVNMSRAGEEGGKLQHVIKDVGDYLKAQLDIRTKVKTALMYPLMMLIFGIGAVVFILTSVMPKITQIFIDSNQILPVPTKIIMTISDILVYWWAWVIIAVLMIIFMVKQWLKTKGGQLFLHDLQLKLPFFGMLWLKEDLARFSRTMALLIDSGVSIVAAMKLAIPTVRNVFVQFELTKCQEELVAGRSFGEQIKYMTLIPDMMGDLIAVGEESGSLAPSLRDVAENYEQEIDDAVKIMTTLFEPIMIVVIGAIIGFVVIAMLLPIFQMDILS